MVPDEPDLIELSTSQKLLGGLIIQADRMKLTAISRSLLLGSYQEG